MVHTLHLELEDEIFEGFMKKLDSLSKEHGKKLSKKQAFALLVEDELPDTYKISLVETRGRRKKATVQS